MGEAIGTEVGKVILEKLGSSTCKSIMFAMELDSHIERLHDTKSFIEAALHDADPLESCSDTQGHMIRMLQRAQTTLEYFFDEKEARAKQKELMSESKFTTEVRLFFSSSNQLVSRFRTARKIKGIRGDVESIARDYALVRGTASISCRNQTRGLILETGPFLGTDVVIGRDNDKDSIMTMLLCDPSNAQESLSVVSIVGIGGQGKTTLAQYVCNDEMVKGCFDVRLWVFATPGISVREVLEKIIASAIDEKPFNCEIAQLQRRMMQAILGKKFLLVLDNVWEGENFIENWGQVKALLKVGAKGSKVLITTRSESVARNVGTYDPYMLRDLGEKDSWKLFQHFAFKPGHESGVEAIGKEIAKMIPRVPLVIKIIGCHLAEKGTVRQWQAFKEELASNSSSPLRDKIMQTLRISYDQLDKKLKLCVAYCSLFPKGTSYNVANMVRIWVALGYVESRNSEDVGEEYVIYLQRCGFFQYLWKDKYGQLKEFKMHDVMHDLVLSVDKFLYQMVDSKTRDIYEGVSHVSFCLANEVDWDAPSSILNIKQQLQSILIVQSRLYNYRCIVLFPRGCDKLITRFEGLKVLDLSRMGIEKVPRSIGVLLHLRYLNLSWNMMCKLPNSITQLVNLLSLDLSWCHRLQELPKNISKLVKLRCLWLQGCYKLNHMPKGLGNLRELQTLERFIVGKDEISCSNRAKGRNACTSLAELRDLNNLKGELTIILARESKYLVTEAKTTHLERKDKLIGLTIEFKKSGKEDEMVLEALRPHGANLRYLKIFKYGGGRLPSWMMKDQLYSLLPNLSKFQLTHFEPNKIPFFFNPRRRIKKKEVGIHFRFEIEGLYQCHDLLVEWFPGLSKMKEQLTVGPIKLKFTQPKGDGSRELTTCKLEIREQLAPSPSPSPSGEQRILFKSCFPNLTELSIFWIPELEVLPEEFRDLTSLNYLTISNCPKLKEIPDWIDSLTSLIELVLSDCPRLESLPHQISNLASLENLVLGKCPQLKELPHSIGSLTSLRKLSINDCSRLESLPHQISKLNQLTDLHIFHCTKAVVKRCLKPTGELWPYIQHITNIELKAFDDAKSTLYLKGISQRTFYMV